MPNIVSVEKMTKRYGDRVLFEDIFFGIEKGEKVALIAQNGTGKTSLLNILAGIESPDTGGVAFNKDYTRGYLTQDPNVEKFHLISDYIFHDDNPIQKVIKEYEIAIAQNDMDLIAKASNAVDALNAWDYEVRIKQIMSNFQVPGIDTVISTLSGGQKKRLALAALLIDQPDFIILDEPTNHLDLEMIEWLENYLTQQNVTVLLVTHDRYFLDRVCNRIFEMDQTKLYQYDGDYEYFLEKKNERMFNESRETDKAKNSYRTELEWIRKMPKARGTKSKSRIQAFDDIKEKALRKNSYQELKFDLKMNRIGGKILELKNVQKKYGDKTILAGFDYTFKRGDKIGIVGRNGVGKSTLLNIITGAEKPDSGKLNLGETIILGYFKQDNIKLPNDTRVIDAIRNIADIIPTSNGSHITASQMLTAFHFPPERQYTYVSKLSGGEKRRLFLLTIIMTNPNFLILDEPTNDLDLLTLNALEEFLQYFAGCLLIVSHDRYFLDKLVDQLFVFEGDGIVTNYNGTYSEYREYTKLKEKETISSKKSNSQPQNSISETKTEIKSNKNKLSFKEKFEFETLEKELPQLEKEKQELEEKLNQGSSNHEDLLQWGQRLEFLTNDIDSKSLRWLELSEST
ncbi:MAG: ABC-F family ATP-binding cassette domain-containing protein [Bacteroidota bacterium]|nr:ABC-F family ATP-binding cassette domain-containing protein [Bacteroidota bacterium]